MIKLWIKTFIYFLKGVKEIKVKYVREGIDKLEKIEKGDWVDLRCAEEVTLNAGQYELIPFGVCMKLPDGYEAHIAPRSSTFKNYKLLQVNSVGVVDSSYCGESDEWRMPVYATEAITIPKNVRIAQFRIVKKQPNLLFSIVEKLSSPSRGGFGSTGVK